MVKLTSSGGHPERIFELKVYSSCGMIFIEFKLIESIHPFIVVAITLGLNKPVELYEY